MSRPVTVIPDYELLERIGSGAYGEVWRARSTATGADARDQDRPSVHVRRQPSF